MNYRHVYHAGNFADVFKHAILVRIIEYLKAKHKPFRVIDTHAGAGVYDLTSEEAQKTGEWRDGIGRLLDADLPKDAAELLEPYLAIVKSFNRGHPFRYYPGSPVIARELLRGRDRLTAIELHPAGAFALKTRFAGDFKTRIIELDGWLALGAHVPPKEKRGLVMTDPPFEEPGEFQRMVDGLTKAQKRWPSGGYAFWYPVKNRSEVTRFRENIAHSGIADILDVSLEIRRPSAEPRLDGCGMIVVNPPYVLHDQMAKILPALAVLFGENAKGAWSINRIAEEMPTTER